MINKPFHLNATRSALLYSTLAKRWLLCGRASLRRTRGFSLKPSTFIYFLIKSKKNEELFMASGSRSDRLLEYFQGLHGHETLPDESSVQKIKTALITYASFIKSQRHKSVEKAHKSKNK